MELFKKLKLYCSGLWRICLISRGVNPTFHRQNSIPDHSLHQIGQYLVIPSPYTKQIPLQNGVKRSSGCLDAGSQTFTSEHPAQGDVSSVYEGQKRDLGSSDCHQSLVNMIFHGMTIVGMVRLEKENQRRACPAIRGSCPALQY
eukprot:1156585-Pelagomonas_calceolata.AAC.7